MLDTLITTLTVFFATITAIMCATTFALVVLILAASNGLL